MLNILILLVLGLSATVAGAQPSTFEDPLLDRFVGRWLLTGTIAGGEVNHDIDAAWVLGHQYLRFHELARERDEFGLPAYEASVTIGWDEPSGRYVCQWLDSTGGGGLIDGAYGYAEPADDTLAFVFGIGEESTWHTTFAYDRAADCWHWTMDGRTGDQVRPFARNTMTRRTEPQSAAASPVLGLDHIVVAVGDLGAAVAAYRQLGFAIKPGRPHANGLRNAHVKFPDGTELELMTVETPGDSLAAEYRRHIAGGDGPAFVAFYAPDPDRLVSLLTAAGHDCRREGDTVSFPAGDPLRYLFFGGRNPSPTDLPAHFDHANGADSLIGVWLAADDLSAEEALLAELGPRPTGVRLLPGSGQLVPGRRIVGATIRTTDLTRLARVIESNGIAVPDPADEGHGAFLDLPPELTHGIRLRFQEP